MTFIRFDALTKRYGAVTAVDDLTAHAAAGEITAFLGANGSGKTTSMRLLLGLAAPTSGSATIDGGRYAELAHPLRTIGAVLDQGFHPHRTARRHLQMVATLSGMPGTRVEQVLETVGLEEAAGRRVGGFSLGMRQRLALGSAIMGDPPALVLDEPFNGLDPAGISWLRRFLRHFADGGGTVLLSSHLLAEIENTADAAIIIDHGRLVRAGSMTALMPAANTITVTSPDADLLAPALVRRGASLERPSARVLVVDGLDAGTIGSLALEAGAAIVAMSASERDLESLFSTLIEQEMTS